MATTWGGFNTENIWDANYGQDLNPLAAQYGMQRDDLAAQRDAFLQPWEQKYRAAVGGGDATSQNLTNSPEFRAFVQNGQLPQGAQPQQAQALPANATPAQQWNAQPAPQPMSAPTAAPSMPGTPPAYGPTAGTGNELIRLLMERAGQPLTVDRTNPAVRQQADAYSANVERSRRDYVSDMAEREGPLGNIEGYRRMAAERAGQASGAFEAELIGREQDRIDRERTGALGQWGGLLQGDQGLGLTRELGYLSNDQRTADRNTSMDQFLRELAQRQYNDANMWDYRYLFGGV